MVITDGVEVVVISLPPPGGCMDSTGIMDHHHRLHHYTDTMGGR